jgi:hypothetical protein
MEPLRVLTNGPGLVGSPWFWRLHWRKKITGNHQNMLHIIPDRERAKPSHLSRPLRSPPAGFEGAKMPPAGRFPKEKREGENRTIYLSKNRSTLFVDNRNGLKDCYVATGAM